MKTSKFDQLATTRLNEIRDRLISKAAEYATETDRLHNFKEAASLMGGTPEQALWGFVAKHIISVKDMIPTSLNTRRYPLEVWIEKLGDIIAYMILLEAVVVDQGDTEVFPESHFPEESLIKEIGRTDETPPTGETGPWEEIHDLHSLELEASKARPIGRTLEDGTYEIRFLRSKAPTDRMYYHIVAETKIGAITKLKTHIRMKIVDFNMEISEEELAHDRTEPQA